MVNPNFIFIIKIWTLIHYKHSLITGTYYYGGIAGGFGGGRGGGAWMGGYGGGFGGMGSVMSPSYFGPVFGSSGAAYGGCK